MSTDREYKAECVFTYLSVSCIHSFRAQFTGSAGWTSEPFGKGYFINYNKWCVPAVTSSSLRKVLNGFGTLLFPILLKLDWQLVSGLHCLKSQVKKIETLKGSCRNKAEQSVF